MGEKCLINLAYNCDFRGNCRVLEHANLRHATDDFTSSPKGGNAESRLFLFAAQCFNIESMQKVFLCHSCV
jgi:hypothetical protein